LTSHHIKEDGKIVWRHVIKWSLSIDNLSSLSLGNKIHSRRYDTISVFRLLFEHSKVT